MRRDGSAAVRAVLVASLVVMLASCGAEGAATVELPAEIVEASTLAEDQALSPGAVTVIRPAQMQGEQKNLPDLLETVPGLRVIRLHGRNGYSVASVRGSTSSQVAVYVDGVLANLQSEAAVDLSTIPVSSVERIEVYRGYIPARFGAQAMGGVINVVTKMPERPETFVSLGVGSFGRKKVAASWADALWGGRLFASGSWEAGDGDHTYFNDNGTPYALDDDYVAKRRNASFEDADLLLKWEGEATKLRAAWIRHDRDLPLVAPGMDHRDGRPQKIGALQETERRELSVEQRIKSGSVDWGIRLGWTEQDKDYDSRRGAAPSQIGGAYVTKSYYGAERFDWGLDASAPLGESGLIELLFEGYRETLHVDGDGFFDYLGGITDYVCEGQQLQLQGSIALDGAGTFVLSPSVRWHKQDDVDKTTWQVGLEKTFSSQWSIKATGGTYARAPNMYERFGDGAFILPARGDLTWEEGTQWDVGLRWETTIGRAESSMILTWFRRESEGLIEFNMESPRYGRYENIADAHVSGLELGWDVSLRPWHLSVSGTWLDAMNDTPDDPGAVRHEGKRLPNRPELAATARLTRSFEKGSAYVEAQYTGDNYGDSSNKVSFGSRTVWNAGIKYALSPTMRLSVGVDDIFDQADGWKLRAVRNGPTRMLWYPTEGRTFYLTLEWQF